MTKFGVQDTKNQKQGGHKHQRQRPGCAFGTLELPAVFHPVVFPKIHIFSHCMPNLIDYAFHVPTRHIAGNHQFTLHIFPAYRIGAVGRDNLGHLAQRHFGACTRRNQGRRKSFNGLRIRLLQTNHQIEAPLAFIYLA